MNTRPVLYVAACQISLLLAPALTAQTWDQEACDPAVVQELNERHERMARSSSYRVAPRPPHLHPKSDEEIVANLLTAYVALRGDYLLDPRTPPHEARFQSALKNHDLNWTVDPVENWTWTRCRSTTRQKQSYLVRAYQDGDEIARFSLWEDGRLGTFAFVDPTHPPPEVPTLERALEEIEGAVELPPGAKPRARYVNSSNHGRCDSLAPCVAVPHATAVYLLQGAPRHELFVFDDTSRRLAWGERPKGLRTLGGPEPGTTTVELFSFGDQWVEARRLELPASD